MKIDDRIEGIKAAEQLADEVIRACDLTGPRGGCGGTLRGALYDAWHIGKFGKRPEPQPEDVVDDDVDGLFDDDVQNEEDGKDAAADKFQSDLDRAESLLDIPF
jgi:hypothetical protein